MSNVEKKGSLLEQIIDGAIDAVKKPFTIKRVKRAFESAKDSIEEQMLSNQASQTTARENLVKAAKDGSNLTSYVQNLIDLQNTATSLKGAQEALKVEEVELLN